jgi:hypothetical protein
MPICVIIKSLLCEKNQSVSYLKNVFRVKISDWLRRSNEEPGIFLGSGSYLVASELDSKEFMYLLEFERLERDGKLKIYRTRNFFGQTIKL